MKITIRTSARIRDYPMEAVKIRPGGRTHSLPPFSSPLPPIPLPCGRSLLSARMGCVCADADAHARKNNYSHFKKLKIIIILKIIIYLK
jgi:hypothetical protein